MKNKKLYIADALSEISDDHITEAAHYKKKPRKVYWKSLGIMAASLAILIFTIFNLGDYKKGKNDIQSIYPMYSVGVEINQIDKPLASTEQNESIADLVWLEPEEIFAMDTSIFRGIVQDMFYYETTGGYSSHFTVISVEVRDVYRGDMEKGSISKIYLPIVPGVVDNSIAGDLRNLEIGSEAIFMPYIATEEKGIPFGDAFFSYADVADYYFSEGERFIFLNTEEGVSYETNVYDITGEGNEVELDNKIIGNTVTLDDVSEYIRDMLK